jgi:ATP/maltotriose-dependent transcriptional regulator MalT
MWLESEVLTLGDDGTSSGASKGSGGAPWDAALAEAKKKIASGDKKAAIDIFQQGINGASQVRDKCYWRCGLADLLLQTGDAEAASALLVSLKDHVSGYSLEEWEPALLARIYTLLYQSYRKQQSKKKDDETLNALVDAVYEQLCWFDPVTALTVKGEK